MRQENEALGAETAHKIVSAQSQETALALASSDVLFRMIRPYLSLLDTDIFPHPISEISEDRKTIKAAKSKLASLAALEALTVVWKESLFVDDDALLIAGMTRSFIEIPLTKHSLSKACCDNAGVTDPAKVHSAQSDINRIFKAAELFGLIARKDKIGNRVPIEGTELLNKLMLEFHGRNALQIHELYRETCPEFGTPGDAA